MRNASPARESSPSAARSARDEVSGPLPWRRVYGLYAWLQFLLIGLLTLALSLCIPWQRTRRHLTRAAARVALALAGMRLRVSALGALPLHCVVVANHVSYIDGVVLHALLPVHFSFVIKREMASVPFAGLLLRRLGAEFVDRRGRQRSIADARRLLRQAGSGQSLVFFPEGTFGPRGGLLPFHIGAFAAAARAQLPVVPIAIRGSRHCLPPESFWPRPGRIEVQALPALEVTAAEQRVAPALTRTGGTGAAAALAEPSERADRAALLRDRAHAALAAALAEPELSPR